MFVNFTMLYLSVSYAHVSSASYARVSSSGLPFAIWANLWKLNTLAHLSKCFNPHFNYNMHKKCFVKANICTTIWFSAGIFQKIKFPGPLEGRIFERCEATSHLATSHRSRLPRPGADQGSRGPATWFIYIHLWIVCEFKERTVKTRSWELLFEKQINFQFYRQLVLWTS